MSPKDFHAVVREVTKDDTLLAIPQRGCKDLIFVPYELILQLFAARCSPPVEARVDAFGNVDARLVTPEDEEASDWELRLSLREQLVWLQERKVARLEEKVARLTSAAGWAPEP